MQLLAIAQSAPTLPTLPRRQSWRQDQQPGQMLGSSTNDENANVAMSYRRFRRLLHQKVRELPPAEVKAILTSHITACRSSSCPTCQKLRLRVAHACQSQALGR